MRSWAGRGILIPSILILSRINRGSVDSFAMGMQNYRTIFELALLAFATLRLLVPFAMLTALRSP